MLLVYFTTVTFGSEPTPKTTVRGELLSLLPYFILGLFSSCALQKDINDIDK